MAQSIDSKGWYQLYTIFDNPVTDAEVKARVLQWEIDNKQLLQEEIMVDLCNKAQEHERYEIYEWLVKRYWSIERFKLAIWYARVRVFSSKKWLEESEDKEQTQKEIDSRQKFLAILRAQQAFKLRQLKQTKINREALSNHLLEVFYSPPGDYYAQGGPAYRENLDSRASHYRGLATTIKPAACVIS